MFASGGIALFSAGPLMASNFRILWTRVVKVKLGHPEITTFQIFERNVKGKTSTGFEICKKGRGG